MKTKLLEAALVLVGLATLPLESFAGDVSGGNANSNWTIYAYQNYSYEWVESENYYGPGDDRSLSRISSNAAHLGFDAQIDTGFTVGEIPVIATFRCEQFVFYNRLNGSSLFGFNDFCNRNSKIGLAGVWGEIMFAQWLLPHNEMVYPWIDPFSDSGATSVSSIMGSVGFGTAFFSSGLGQDNGGGFGGFTNFGSNTAGPVHNSFNRRQGGVIQWFSPNWNGFTARIATSNAHIDSGFNYFSGNGNVRVTTASGTTKDVDPRIWSMGIAYETDVGSDRSSIWGALTYEKHDEWAAADFGCRDSDDDSWRIAGRYIHDWGNGHSTWISGAYEEIEYDHKDCATGRALLGGNGVAGNRNEVERDAWMISGKHNFPGPLDIRFSYMDADDLDCDSGAGSSTCNGGLSDSSSSGDAYNIGLSYTLPTGTELRLTYSELNNSRNAGYDFGQNSAGVSVVGSDLEMIGFGMTQWF